VPESRLDQSALRILTQKFKLGLFENPYADTANASRVVGSAAFQDEATRAQRRALVLLKNAKRMLPVKAKGKRVFVIGVDSSVAASYGFVVVRDPAQAQLAIARIDAPFERLHPQYMFGSMQHEGNLGYRANDSTIAAIRQVAAKVPTIVTVYLDRPAILSALVPSVMALVANFGVSDGALLDVLTGKAKPEGKLPFELPSSMAAVSAQKSDVAHDSQRPLYPFGFGLRY
jgi:beta-glucosidase